MSDGFFGGLTIGALMASVFYLLLTDRFLCRVGWHKWNPWSLGAGGGGQLRRCEKCGLYDVKPFRTFTLTNVPEPKHSPKPACADCLGTGFKVTDEGAARCVHAEQAPPAHD